MRDIVVVPCYERPEFTWVCLEYLSRARGIENKIVLLHQDQHTYDAFGQTRFEMAPVVDRGCMLFPDRFNYVLKEDSLGYEKNTYGNSANLIAALRTAYDAGAPRIFLVEDDIMVAPDFFEWHEDILETAHPLVSCATALNKSAHFQINGPDTMDETCKDPSAYLQRIGPYSSHAVAFDRFCVGDLLKYFDKNQFVWEQGLEQDIRTQQFLKNTGSRSVWPYVPRAFNVGIYSYHISGMRFNGTLEEKIAALQAVIKDPEKLTAMAFGNQTVTPIPHVFPVRTKQLFERYR